MTEDFDTSMMKRCIELAKRALGRTSPNPMVGAVVVKDGRVVGEGFHPGAGKPHAEVFALQQAGEAARGATVYVNLEPCNHYGRTPPCTEALIAAGVRRVVVGMVDPDERVCGRGIERLKAAGIEVKVGVAQRECLRLNEAFVHRVKTGLPFGILKYAMTLDGKIATAAGDSKWITGESSRHFVHQLRASCDAVVVGGNTVRKDNPLLTSHGVSDHNPVRVVMTRTFELPLDAQIWHTDVAPTIVFTTFQQENSYLKQQLLARGVEIVEMENLNPRLLMADLTRRGFNSVLWECGGNLAAEAIASGCVQKVYCFVAPKIVGGNTAPTPVGDLNIHSMQKALLLHNTSVHRFDEDLLMEGYLETGVGELFQPGI
ncbi:MAG: bifunctional diaminohydroxyphosphoribosylaminopyrimidine deaminase/5-amino-6-(5-phosphoribosylamino)uracil reductase RibD [Geminocystis sp.]|nr:bifunctional diaminohydroxyphosphoribosylaminopyrimidine deaminase/5-amino-6-(5-phosphoribosylamino)uracil reductase RibD [Geminocystis sp.]MCS7147475.1 bifunctional diaminohydroxyphosphoribosylaminopyrimidine deaminase/5-amino-6-(5-phosphoribosylamino)uracil reductase RibD [Geminocystis sp.]MDW8115168.1 bifunctional diaminohydroxyphosphoribosylaminopyrimidine deaminase/5-amino-6-(5-phosphoribosylamino)uracil reductase RibD [Geminocystis sp.]MDW8464436.1 bifunctional diaminohydroxyphosphoribo